MQTSRRSIVAWCFYDFGNSAFTTLIVTFIYGTYFSKMMSTSETEGTWLWSMAISISAVFIALISPIVGAAADRTGRRKLFLWIASMTCILGAVMTYFPLPHATLQKMGLPDQAWQALFWFMIGNIAFEVGSSLYNSFLPTITTPENIGRISGYGWGLGYVGGLLCMAIALVGFVQTEHPWFGFSLENGENLRATNLLVAVWMLVFCTPYFFLVPSIQRKEVKMDGNFILDSFRRIGQTFTEIKKYKQLVRFLLANVFYNDGLVTIFSIGAIYAATALKFEFSEIMMFGIVLNVTAGIGAVSFGFLDDRLGGKRTIKYSIWGLTLAVLMACLSPNKTVFWIAGVLVGVFAGPNQSASRSLIGRFVPPSKESEFYGFFTFAGRCTSFLGPLLFGNVTALVHYLYGGNPPFEPQRAGVGVLLILFAIGWYMLSRVDEAAGIAAAKE
jgi:UMF1 family MFS transporter